MKVAGLVAAVQQVAWLFGSGLVAAACRQNKPKTLQVFPGICVKAWELEGALLLSTPRYCLA